ncbi:DUF2795 domain-containing protein [Actinomadura flavalba]|uniref:DUF2795 domain-containing protein n=1 Tax=Actinomadura flavalba TaxID=1120938 RepID=UPI0003673797|nr:DUF2795 domain-containing protein [Actinomadura flavalba]
MGEQSDKNGPRLDDELRAATRGMTTGNHATHAEDFKEVEPVSDGPIWDPAGAPDPAQSAVDPARGAPPGMSPSDVDQRSDLARALSGLRYPATRADLVAHISPDASDEAITALETLPDREYASLGDVAEELGYGREERRY